MTDTEILAELKKATDLWMDKTYTESEFYSHCLAVMRDAIAPHAKHRDQLERLIFKVEQMRENQRLYWGGHKQLIGKCKTQEAEMDKKIMNLQCLGYSIERFKKAEPVQNQMFK